MSEPDPVLAGLRWRYATKKFDPARRLDAATLAALEEALLLSPSSFGLQPWKFLWVETPGLRQRLRAASWNQAQVTEAPHYLVLCRRAELSAADVDRWVSRLAQVRGVEPASLAGYRRTMVGGVENPDSLPGGGVSAYAARQVYLALGVLLATAAALRVDSCPLEGFDPAAYDAILGLDRQGWRATVACALGHRAADDHHAVQAKVRFEASEVVARV